MPLCVLTDGREWSFYLPSGQGTYDDRRIYRLQIDDRSSEDSEATLQRYLNRIRVKSNAAFEAAQQDYRDAAAKREAARVIPKAWSQLVEGPEDLLVELLSDQAEALAGFRPEAKDVTHFLRSMQNGYPSHQGAVPVAKSTTAVALPSKSLPPANVSKAGRSVDYEVFGQSRNARNANSALLDILSTLAARHPSQVSQLADAVKGNRRNHIARSVQEIYPDRPDLARAEEFAPGWLIGLNIANREKIGIIKKACEVFGLRFGSDVQITLPNQ